MAAAGGGGGDDALRDSAAAARPAAEGAELAAPDAWQRPPGPGSGLLGPITNRVLLSADGAKVEAILRALRAAGKHKGPLASPDPVGSSRAAGWQPSAGQDTLPQSACDRVRRMVAALECGTQRGAAAAGFLPACPSPPRRRRRHQQQEQQQQQQQQDPCTPRGCSPQPGGRFPSTSPHPAPGALGAPRWQLSWRRSASPEPLAPATPTLVPRRPDSCCAPDPQPEAPRRRPGTSAVATALAACCGSWPGAPRGPSLAALLKRALGAIAPRSCQWLMLIAVAVLLGLRHRAARPAPGLLNQLLRFVPRFR